MNQEMVAIIDNLLEYKSMTPTQHKEVFKKLNLIKRNVNKQMFFFLLLNV